MISNKEKEQWHYLALKIVSTLLREITWKYCGDCYWLNCLHAFRTEDKLIYYEKICKTKDFCGIVMPSEKDKILEFNQYTKSEKAYSLTIFNTINLGSFRIVWKSFTIL